MKDEVKFEAVRELVGKLISDAETEMAAVKRYRQEMAGADRARIKDRAEMVAISIRVIARAGEKIDRLVQAILAEEPERQAEPIDDLGLCTQAGEGGKA